MPLDPRIRKALLRNRNQMKATRVNQAFKYAKEHDIKGVTKKSILQYIKEIDPNKDLEDKNPNKKFVFRYIGGWFADIGFNRNKEMGRRIDGDRWLKQFVLFVNGNSGWAKVYEAPSKHRNVISSIVQRFIRDMGKYPVRQIITDNDNAFDDQSLPIKKIQSEIVNNETEEHSNHRLFSRIDTFMSHLRSYAWREYNVGTVNGHKAKICDQPKDKEFYIPFDTIQRFVHEWNEHVIPVVRCTRNEMMKDKNLELAYICHALYGNELKNELRKAITGDVKLKTRVRFNDLGANRQERASGERAGVYTVTGSQDGHYVGVDKEGRVVHFNANEVASRYDNSRFENEEFDLAGVEDEINDESQWQGSISRYEGPKPEKPIKRKREKPEPSKQDAAQLLAVEEQMRDLERGIPPDISPEKILENTKKWLKHLEEVDPMRYTLLINEAMNRPRTLRKSTMEKIAKSWNIQAASGTPFVQQDIPIDSAYKSGQVVKLKKQQQLRNGRRANKAKNNSTRKQKQSKYSQFLY